MARRVIRTALLHMAHMAPLALLSLTAGCERREATPAPAGETVRAEAAAPRGAGVPFEVGDAPDIRELEKVDLAMFVAGDPWCTRGRGGRRVLFVAGGEYVESSEDGTGERRGTWRVAEGRLSVTLQGEEARSADATAAAVNEKEVLLLDGLLYGRCAERG